jgi:hypothetical protein
MPFDQPFREFDAKTDIIFGLTTPDRNQFLNFKNVTLAARNRAGIPLFIDGFDDLNRAVGEKTNKIPQDIKDNHRNAVLHAYPEAATEFANDKVNALDRKKSKGSLYWAAREGIHLHFVMYALATPDSQRKIATKTSTKGGTNSMGDQPKGSKPSPYTSDRFESDAYWDKSRQVTGSELRWIYRMRNSEKVRQIVQFWRSLDGKDFEKCPPPWEWADWSGTDYRKIWSQYKPTREGLYDTILSDGSA